MEGKYLSYLLGLSLVLSGCVVRTYPLTKDRVDQDLSSGNRGYLQGQASPVDQGEKKMTRRTQVVEIELHPPIRFERLQKEKYLETPPVEKIESQPIEGNRGYITQTVAPKMVESAPSPSFEKYTAQKGDTLQKISQRFYGTTRKWNKIYEVNKGILKGPNKLYVGQSLNIPVEGLKETRKNLK
jgi:nucleoid-associated protein YgaU